jgi:glycosyltransferase involved in cell wall biosynthesis
MQIAAISNSRIPSTTANSMQAMKVCDAMTALGHAITLFVPAEVNPTSWQDLARHYGLHHQFPLVRLASAPWLKRLDFVWRALGSTRELQPDLVYTWLPQTAALSVRVRQPTVLEMHADVGGRLGPWWLRQFWYGNTKRRLLVTTTALLNALQRSTGLEFPPEQVQIAPNAVDFERYAELPEPEKARRNLGYPATPLIGFMGHFYAGRGIDLLFDLARAMPSLQFLWVGGTDAAVREWRGRVAAAGLPNVIMTGFVDNSELPSYQAASDILLMPYGQHISASSGQDIAGVINPMKMYEYMAAGRAIVTADLPSIREILDEDTAVFCPSGDLEVWKSAIAALVSDPARRNRLGTNARKRARQHSWIDRARLALDGFSAL